MRPKTLHDGNKDASSVSKYYANFIIKSFPHLRQRPEKETTTSEAWHALFLNFGSFFCAALREHFVFDMQIFALHFPAPSTCMSCAHASKLIIQHCRN